jgi:putative ABC transport system permease protein
MPYTVVGILHRQHGVLDRLVLTGLESVWSVHGDHGHDGEHDHGHEYEHHEHKESHEHDEHEHHGHAETEARHTPTRKDAERQLTAILIQYRSPMGAVLLPRQINQRSHLQAAVPAVELSRLLQLFGVGLDTLRLFGLLLIASAGLGVFIALYNTLRERRYDLAIMRTLGASRLRLFNHILLEGVILAVLGSLLGILLGHIGIELLGNQLTQARQLELTGWIWLDAEWGLLLLALSIGLLAAVLPAIQAYRSDIAHILSKGQ